MSSRNEKPYSLRFYSTQYIYTIEIKNINYKWNQDWINKLANDINTNNQEQKWKKKQEQSKQWRNQVRTKNKTKSEEAKLKKSEKINTTCLITETCPIL